MLPLSAALKSEMSGALAVGGSGDCDLPHPTRSTAATIETGQQPLLMSWLYLFSKMISVHRFIKR
jgi:hypothetical protein